MGQQSSESSEALARLKQTQPTTAAADPTEHSEQYPQQPSSNGVSTTKGLSRDTEQAAVLPDTAPAKQASLDDDDEKVTLRDSFNAWLDSFRGPTQEDIEQAIASTPDRLQARWQKLQDDRRRALEEKERLARLEEEVRAAKEALATQREREAEKMAELERQQAIEAHRRQQERETEALLKAAREIESDDIPAPENRPMLQQPGEYLSDDQLLILARQNLPEWQRLERIVNKARAIEAQTPTPQDDELPAAQEDDHPYVLPFRKPLTDDPDPRHLDGFRRVTLSISWVLFVVVGVFALGWLGPWPSILDAHDGIYAGSTSLLSMAAWHVAAWPLLWVLMLIYTLYQWAPSQYSAVRNRATAWYVSNAMLLASGAILLAHFQPYGAEALTCIAALVLLMKAMGNLNKYTERNRRERFLVDFPIGAFTGWMLIFSATTSFTALASWNLLDLLLIPEIIWAIVAFLALLVILSQLALTGRGRMSVVLGFAFGTSAIVGSRLFGENESFLLTGIALLGLFIIVAATENRRYQISIAEKQAMEHLVYVDSEDAPTGQG